MIPALFVLPTRKVAMKVTQIVIQLDREIGPQFIEYVINWIADAASLLGAKVVTTAESVEVEELPHVDEN